MSIDILVKKYEAGGMPGAINENDGKGIMSYGCFQFNAGDKIVQNFIAWMNQEDNFYNFIGKRFEGLEATTEAFNVMWKAIAKEKPVGFEDAQYQYAKLMYYDKAIELLAKINFIPKSVAVMNAIFSFAIQYSPYKVPIIFNEAAQWYGFEDCTKFEDEESLLAAVYFIRATDKWNKGNRQLLYRCMLECHDAFDLLKNNE